MKVRASVKKISPDDIIVRRKGRLRVINKLKRKHNQVQG
jgi:large subunit ribosomal protein L36